MPICAATFNGKDNDTGVVYQALRLDSAGDIATCQYLVISGTEYTDLQAAGLSDALNITPEQGSLIGGAILLVWAIGWVFGQIARALNVDESSERETT